MATNPLSTMRFHRSLGIFVIIFTRISLISQSILNRFSCNFAGSTCNYSGDCPEKFVKFERVFLKLLVRLVVNLLEYFKIYSFRRQFRHQFSTVYHVILQAPWYYGDCPVNYVKFERILQKLLMRLVWYLIEYFKSYLFRRQFRRQFFNRLPCSFAGTIEWYYGHCPVNSVEFERVLQKLLMRLVWNLLEYFNIYIHLDVNSDVNSQRFFM